MKSNNIFKVLKTVFFTAAALICFSVSVYSSSDGGIFADGGTAVIKYNGTPGVAVVVTHSKKGYLKEIMTKPVTEDKPAIFKDLSAGDKVMYWKSVETMEPLAPSVTITGDYLSDDTAENKKIRNIMYEAAFENAIVEALGSKKGENMTELQKALALHDWLVENCQYDVTKSNPNKFRPYGAIVNGLPVCQGYAEAYEALLGYVGIKSEVVTGTKRDSYGMDNHAWNRVTINGTKYYVDVTGDDPVPNSFGTVSRTYFLVSDRVLQKNGYADYSTHCTDTTYEEYDMFNSFYMRFIWNEDIQKFYYIDLDKVKTTSDFTETLTPSSNENGPKPSSYFITEDGKYVVFFRPSFITSQSTVYIYSFEYDEYYTYLVKDIDNVIFCRVRQKGNNIEVVRDYYKNGAPTGVGVMKTIPLPKKYEKRKVTFDQNYNGGTVSSCYYLDNYWTDGDGSFDTPERKNSDFRGWFTQKDGGTKVENFEEISGSDVTLYAHWWGDWKISKNPTETETGTLTRKLESNEKITEEKILPVLTDTSVWTLWNTKDPTTESEGYRIYKSDYGKVKVTLPRKPPECSIDFIDGKYHFDLVENGTYYAKFEIGEQSETVDMPNNYGQCTLMIKLPENLSGLTGTLTVTLYDSEMNQICQNTFDLT